MCLGQPVQSSQSQAWWFVHVIFSVLEKLVCHLRRQNLQFIERAYALLLWLPVHAAHLCCVLWQQELLRCCLNSGRCLNSGLYSVCSGQSPHASGETLSLSPILISTPSVMPTLEALPPSRGDAKCSHTSGSDPTPAVEVLRGWHSLTLSETFEMGHTGNIPQRQANDVRLPPLQIA